MPATDIRRRGNLGLIAAAAAAIAAAAAFAAPWLRAEPRRTDADRYLGTRDGASGLEIVRGPDGRALRYESTNTSVMSILQASVRLDQALQNPLFALVARGRREPSEEDVRRTRVIEVRRTKLPAAGAPPGGGAQGESLYFARTPQGVSQLGSQQAGSAPTVVDPALLVLPGDLSPGRRWRAAAKVGGTLTYELSGRVAGRAPYRGPAGAYEDCIAVESRIAARAPTGQATPVEVLTDRYCAGIGRVESLKRDAAGRLVERTTLISADDGVWRRASPPPGAALRQPGGIADDPAGWRMTLLGRSRPSGEPGATTIPPTWVGTPAPVVLAAAQGGDLVALDAQDGRPRWRFRPAGSIFGAPGVDLPSGRVYFGTSDRRVYALDARGLFLWSRRLGDNVPTRPLEVGGIVVAGSEDGTIHGLDARTGAPRWEVDAGGAVASSPAAAGPVVAVGSDGGSVHGIDPRSGRVRWRTRLGGAVEAPLAAHRDTLYAVTRAGLVVSLRARDGRRRWTRDLGDTLRTAPAPRGGALYVTGENGRVVSLRRSDGRVRWISRGSDYRGSPVAVPGGVVVARKPAALRLIGADGRVRRNWAATPGGETRTPSEFDLGPTLGGGALWVADDAANVYRVGPGASQAAELRARWVSVASQSPFAGAPVGASPAEYRGQAVVADERAAVYLVDAGTGRGRRIGQLQTGRFRIPAGPVVAGDTLVAAGGDHLVAAALPAMRARWSVRTAGDSLHPPAVGGGTVAVLVRAGAARGAAQPARIEARDIATGRLRWRAPTQVAGSGGAAIDGGTVYGGSPPSARDAATGRVRWRAATGAALTTGRPGLDTSTVYVAVQERGGAGGAIVALDRRTGRARWRAAASEPPSIGDAVWAQSGRAICATGRDTVAAVDARTGRPAWKYTAPAPRHGTISAAAGRVAITLANATVVVLDARTGRVMATFTRLQLDLAAYPSLARPALIGGTYVVALGPGLLGLAAPEAGG